MTVILYVCRDGANEELRYSLRSLVNLPHTEVWVAGGAPDWLTNVNRIPVPQAATKYQSATRNLQAFCNHPDTPEHFTLFNDDFFIMTPHEHIDTVHLGPLTNTIDHYSRMESFAYLQAAHDTRDMLKAEGINHPLSYEAHMPMPLTKTAVRNAYRLSTKHTPNAKHTMVRTLVGNLTNAGAHQIDDVKVRTLDHVPPTPIVSTNDASFTHGAIGATIRAQFPTKCRYET